MFTNKCPGCATLKPRYKAFCSDDCRELHEPAVIEEPEPVITDISKKPPVNRGYHRLHSTGGPDYQAQLKSFQTRMAQRGIKIPDRNPYG